MSDAPVTHVSDTAASEALIALREMQPTPTPPAEILVGRAPPPRPTLEDVVHDIHDVREDVKRLEKRFDGLEERFDGMNNRFDMMETQFTGLQITMQQFMQEMRELMAKR